MPPLPQSEQHLNLTSGKKMPIIGLGTWLADDEEQLAQAIDTALEIGYRHFDTALVYGNEQVLGKTLKKWIDLGKITREELFIVTKLPICGLSQDKVGHFLKISLNNLGLDYVDLYLIHVPFGLQYTSDSELMPIRDGKVLLDLNTNLEKVWEGMEGEVKAGRAKSIGISNFDEGQVERIVKVSKIKPSNLQVELHAYFQQKSLQSLCKKHDISITAYAPFASPGRKGLYDLLGIPFQPCNLLEDATVVEIASSYGKSPSQILLKYLIQRGIAVIPKSTNATRIKENFMLFDFELNSSDMKKLETLDKGEAGRTIKFEFLPGIEKHPEFHIKRS